MTVSLAHLVVANIDPVSAVAALLGGALVVVLVLGHRRRLRAESDLADARERIHLSAESGGLGFWEWQVEGDRIWLSDRGRLHFGLDAAVKATRALLLEQIHPEDR